MKRIMILTLLIQLIQHCFIYTEEKSKHSNQEDESVFWAQPSEGTKIDDRSGEKPETKVTGTITFLSDYRDRGISQTFRRSAVQGELRYDHVSGFYGKMWGSNVDGTGNFISNGCLELDFHLGYRGKYFKTPLEVDCGFEIYIYPNARAVVPKYVTYNSVEYFFSLTYKGFDVQFHQTITDYFGVCSNNPPINWDKLRPIKSNGHSWGSPYIEMNWEFPLRKKFKMALHMGYQAVINYPKLNFLDWQASVVYSFDWFDLAISYVQSTGKKAFYKVPTHTVKRNRVNLAGAGLYAGISHSF